LFGLKARAVSIVFLRIVTLDILFFALAAAMSGSRVKAAALFKPANQFFFVVLDYYMDSGEKAFILCVAATIINLNFGFFAQTD
jgi:hypothetical protein